MGYVLFVFFALLAQLKLSIESQPEEIKSGIPANNLENSSLNPSNSEIIEDQSSDSSIINPEQESGSEVEDVESVTSSEPSQPDTNNLESKSIPSVITGNESLDNENDGVEESTDPSESKSDGVTHKNEEDQIKLCEKKGEHSGGIYHDNSSILVISSDSQPQSNSYNIYINDVPMKLYLPLKGYKYVEIKDKNTTLWKAKEWEYANMVYLVQKKGKERMIMIMAEGLQRNKYCYKNEEDRWEKIRIFEYYAKIFMPLESEKEFKVYELDIGGNYNEDCICVDSYVDQLHTKMYFDKAGSKVGTIKRGEQILHKTNFLLEVFSKVKMTLIGENPAFLDIELFTLSFKRNIRYEMVNGLWKPISDLSYRNKLRIMKACEENKREVESSLVSLDLNEVNENRIQVKIRSYSSMYVASMEYKPKHNGKLGYIVYEGAIVWTNMEEEECSAVVTYHTNMPMLIVIDYKDAHHKEYLKYESNKWHEIEKSEYTNKIEDLHSVK